MRACGGSEDSEPDRTNHVSETLQQPASACSRNNDAGQKATDDPSFTFLNIHLQITIFATSHRRFGLLSNMRLHLRCFLKQVSRRVIQLLKPAA